MTHRAVGVRAALVRAGGRRGPAVGRTVPVAALLASGAVGVFTAVGALAVGRHVAILVGRAVGDLARLFTVVTANLVGPVTGRAEIVSLVPVSRILSLALRPCHEYLQSNCRRPSGQL